MLSKFCPDQEARLTFLITSKTDASQEDHFTTVSYLTAFHFFQHEMSGYKTVKCSDRSAFVI